jgi:hypothetical protein
MSALITSVEHARLGSLPVPMPIELDRLSWKLDLLILASKFC